MTSSIREDNLSPSPEFDPYYEQEGDDSWLDDAQDKELSLGEGPDTNFYGDMKSNVSVGDIRKLYQGIDAQNLPNEKELLSTLREALKDISSNNNELKSHGADLFYQVQESSQAPEGKTDVNGGASSDTNNTEGTQTSGEGEGQEGELDTPTRTDKGVQYFESKMGEEFELHPQGKGTKSEVDTSGNVVITPQDPKTPVVLSQEGDSIIVTVKGDKGDDVYKISSQVSNFQIVSDHVSGDVKNWDGRIKVGKDSNDNYISPERLNDLSSKIQASASQVGYVHYKYDDDMWSGDPFIGGVTFSEKYTVGYFQNYGPPGQGKYNKDGNADKKQAGSKAEAEDVKEVLPKIAEAIKDPKNKENWNSVVDDISRWDTQNTNKGIVNNRAHLLFNVLYGELGGEEGLKDALKSGILPSSFVNKLADILNANPEEANKMDSEVGDYQRGGPQWTHATAADFLKKYSGTPSGT